MPTEPECGGVGDRIAGDGCLVAPPAPVAALPAESSSGEVLVWAVSLSIVVHAVVLLVLSIVTMWLTSADDRMPLTLEIAATVPAEQLEPITIEPVPLPAPGETLEDALPTEADPLREQLLQPDLTALPSPLESSLSRPRPAKPVEAPAAAPQVWLPKARFAAGGSLEGRDPATRTRLVARHGGTPASEAAVARALAWLAMHQRSDGGWRFDLRETPCRGQCANSGTHTSTTAATSLALLPFLGAGQTHRTGEHRETVRRGLTHLLGRMRDTPQGGDWQEGTMYAQGLTAIVLCEAYALTRDNDLRRPAQKAIDFIAYAQHPTGGWRYFPKQPGDCTVFGWQMMALKSAQLAGLNPPEETIARGYAWLDTVQMDSGASYGYLTPDRAPTPTAIGLLCRLFQGRVPQDPAVALGIERVAALGPQADDLYFNYQATQLLHHAGSTHWPEWNRRLRDRLVQAQARSGHEAGSWYFADPHGMVAGRLYTTALATLILEVYYRHLPLYGAEAIAAGG